MYHPNDVLLFSRDTIHDGDTVLFLNNESGMLYIRRFRRSSPWCMEPIVYYGETFTIDDTDRDELAKWTVLGRVITKMRA